MKRVKAACLCQTLHFLPKEDLAGTMPRSWYNRRSSTTRTVWTETAPNIRFLRIPYSQTVLLFSR